MKIRPKNFGEALIPLTTVSTIIGHGGSHCRIVQRHSIVNAIYATIVTSLYCVAFGFTLDFCSKYSWFDPNDHLVVYLTWTNTGIAGLARMHSWYYAKIHASYADEISSVDETLRKCGSSFDYTKTFNLGIAAIGIELIAVSIINAMEMIWFVKVLPGYQILIINCVLLHPVHIKSIIVCNFSLQVWLIGERFHAANKILEEALNLSQRQITDQAWPFLGQPTNTSILTLSTLQISNDVRRRQHLIQIIKHVHLELCVISKKLNQAHGLEIALAIGAYFVTITTCVIECISEIPHPSEKPDLRVIINLVCICAYCGELILVNQVCEKVSAESMDQAKRTGQIIHCINEPIGNPGLRDEIKQFSLQLIQCSLHFSPAGLFILGSEFVVQFIASVVTYATIFVQIHCQIEG